MVALQLLLLSLAIPNVLRLALRAYGYCTGCAAQLYLRQRLFCSRMAPFDQKVNDCRARTEKIFNHGVGLGRHATHSGHGTGPLNTHHTDHTFTSRGRPRLGVAPTQKMASLAPKRARPNTVTHDSRSLHTTVPANPIQTYPVRPYLTSNAPSNTSAIPSQTLLPLTTIVTGQWTVMTLSFAVFASEMRQRCEPSTWAVTGQRTSWAP